MQSHVEGIEAMDEATWYAINRRWYHYEHSDNAWKLQSLEKCAALFRPKLIVDGASAYAHLYDYARIRKANDDASVSDTPSDARGSSGASNT
ncbi:hypothetical protein Lal_00035076 [Lupinus albus]|nr:hypothetical protein Lal_00035076 [Lupinus albus]